MITTADFKQNEDRFRLVLKNNPHPMWIYDHQTLQFRDVNPAALAKYGYTREEFLKMKITEIRTKDQVPRLLAEHKRFGMNRKHLGERKQAPLKGLWAHQKGGFYHDGRFQTLLDVINHYNNLGLTDQEKADLTEFLKSL